MEALAALAVPAELNEDYQADDLTLAAEEIAIVFIHPSDEKYTKVLSAIKKRLERLQADVSYSMV